MYSNLLSSSLIYLSSNALELASCRHHTYKLEHQRGAGGSYHRWGGSRVVYMHKYMIYTHWGRANEGFGGGVMLLRLPPFARPCTRLPVRLSARSGPRAPRHGPMRHMGPLDPTGPMGSMGPWIFHSGEAHDSCYPPYDSFYPTYDLSCPPNRLG